MFAIRGSCSGLLGALQRNESIVMNVEGEWYVEGKGMHLIRRIFEKESKQVVNISNAFVRCMDELEGTPIFFGPKGKNVREKQDPYLLVATALLKRLEVFSSETKVIAARKELERKRISLLYRLEAANGGQDPQHSNTAFTSVQGIAQQWKQSQWLYLNKGLSTLDMERVRETAQYPEFVKLIEEDLALREEYCKWAFRHHCRVDTFVQYPSLSRTLQKSLLACRIGALGGQALKIQQENNQKLVTLPFEGREINILKPETQVTFSGNCVLTIREIFQIFREKKRKIGDLEFFSNGIRNWNSYRGGFWNAKRKGYQPIDLNQSEWWKQIPVLETIDREEAERRYGGVPENEKDWIVTAMSSRESATLDISGHAYLEIAIPTGDGRYEIYNFGKFVVNFPFTSWESFKFLGETVQATISTVDENRFYSHRQRLGYPFIFTPEEGKQLMSQIREDLLKARRGYQLRKGGQHEMIFNLHEDNCAKWVEENIARVKGRDHVPNLYKMDALTAEPQGALGRIVIWIKQFSPIWQRRFVTLLLLSFAPWRGKWVKKPDGTAEWKSVMKTEFWKTHRGYSPAYLAHQIATGTLSSPFAQKQKVA